MQFQQASTVSYLQRLLLQTSVCNQSISFVLMNVLVVFPELNRTIRANLSLWQRDKEIMKS